jgi:hypothetical protein
MPSTGHRLTLGWSQHMSMKIPSTGAKRRSTSSNWSAK